MNSYNGLSLKKFETEDSQTWQQVGSPVAVLRPAVILFWLGLHRSHRSSVGPVAEFLPGLLWAGRCPRTCLCMTGRSILSTIRPESQLLETCKPERLFASRTCWADLIERKRIKDPPNFTTFKRRKWEEDILTQILKYLRHLTLQMMENQRKMCLRHKLHESSQSSNILVRNLSLVQHRYQNRNTFTIFYKAFLGLTKAASNK